MKYPTILWFRPSYT